MVTAAARGPYVPFSHSLSYKGVSIIRCGIVLGGSTVAP